MAVDTLQAMNQPARTRRSWAARHKAELWGALGTLVGVVLGMQADRGNVAFQEAESTHRLRHVMLACLFEELDDLNQQITTTTDGIAATRQLIALADSGTYDELSKDRLGAVLFQALYYSTFAPSPAGYQAWKVGGYAPIADDATRDSLIMLYERRYYEYRTAETEFKQHLFVFRDRTATELLGAWPMSGKRPERVPPADLDRLFSDRRFRFFLQSHLYQLEDLLSYGHLNTQVSCRRAYIMLATAQSGE